MKIMRGYTRTPRRLTRGVLLMTLLLMTLLLTALSAVQQSHASGPAITSVVFTGDAANPTITVMGSGFGSLPAPNPSYTPAGNTAPGITYTCPSTTKSDGFDYGMNLGLLDLTGSVAEGRFQPSIDELDCIGVIVLSYSDTQVQFQPGYAYTQYAYKPLAQGDAYSLIVQGTSYSGNVSYQNTGTPTATGTPMSTSTNTPVPPTNTPTNTPVLPTATSTPTAAASISLSRSSGRYKDPVTVTGSGFGHSETVNVYLDTTASTPLTSTSSNASGGLSAVFIAPQAISGTHTILAVGQSSGRSGSAPWLELPGAYLLHYQGNKGSTDVLKGAGFAPHETVTGYWNTPSGTPFGFTATTNSVGTFGGSSSYPGITFTVPLSPTGQYPVYALGQSSHGVAHATFTLNPSLSVKPTSAHAGAVVTVSGTGYGANETVTIKYNCGTSGCSSTTVLATPTTDGNGFFSTSVTLPGTTSMGVHALGGKGTTSGVFATTSITIT